MQKLEMKTVATGANILKKLLDLPAIESAPLYLMPKEGIEPSPPCGDGILNPARLPVPPLRPQNEGAGIRTQDLRIKSALLYLLSYALTKERILKLLTLNLSRNNL